MFTMEESTEFIVYILYSPTYDKFYIGYTANLIARMQSHNVVGRGYTKRYRPWEVVYVEVFATKNEALKREKFLKSGKGRKWRKEHIKTK